MQNTSNYMDNHLMAIPADHIVTVYIPVTVDEVVHEAAIKFAAVNDIPEIGFSRWSEQCKKSIPHILLGSNVPMMQISSKKREYSFLICSYSI